MTKEPRVLRSFFLEQRVDQLVSRISLEGDVSKNEVFRFLLQAGMRPFVDGQVQFGLLGAQPGSEQSEKEDAGKVLRSIYMDREFDDYMRHTAFAHRVSKSELMRRFIDRALDDVQANLQATKEQLDRDAARARLERLAEQADDRDELRVFHPATISALPSTNVSAMEKVASAVARVVGPH